jgi:hypothetical protein
MLTLIDGVFTPCDARMILMEAFSSKIRFHQLNNFSAKERFGKEDPVAKHKIALLGQSLKRISEITEYALGQNIQLEISAQVIITYKGC